MTMSEYEERGNPTDTRPARFVPDERWIVLIGCLLLGVLSAAQLYSILYFGPRRVPFWRVMCWQSSGWFFWALLTPVVFRLCRAFPLVAGRLARSIPVHVVTGGVLAAMQSGLIALVRYFVPLAGPNDLTPGQALVGALAFVHINLLSYWAIVGTVSAFDFYRRWRVREVQTIQLREDLLHAQLQALQMQLQPHFLFNTLHTIATLVGEEPAMARRMIARLGDFLRLTLYREAAERIPLADELEFVRAYLAIAEVRFLDRLRVEYHIDPATLAVRVPYLILQPLVENAVRHGLSGKAEAGRLEIRSAATGNRLRIEVRDSGGKLGTATGGVGLANIQGRLARMYGSDWRFSLDVDGDGMTVAAVEIPLS